MSYKHERTRKQAIRELKRCWEAPPEVWETLDRALARGNVHSPEDYLRRVLVFRKRATYETEQVTPTFVRDLTQGDWWHTHVEQDETTGCHLWRGQTNPHGYGVVRVDGPMIGAHRVAYQRRFGPIHDGHHVHHVCRVRRCVNPAHLVPVPKGLHMRLHSMEDAVGKAIVSGELYPRV